MNKKSPSNKSYLFTIVFSIVGFLVLLGYIFVRNRGSLGSYSKQVLITAPQLKDTRAQWTSLKFEPIKTNDSFKSKVRSIPITATNVSLRLEQLDNLKDSIYNFAIAYYDGSFEAYKRFRAPISDYRLQTDKIVYKLNRVEKRRGKGLQWKVSDRTPEEFEKLLWVHAYDGRPFWFSLALENSLCLVEDTTNITTLVTLPFQLINEKASFINGSSPPNLIFHRTPETVIEESGSVTTALISWVAKTRDPDGPRPFVCRFFWDPKHNVWLPFLLVYSQAGTVIYDEVF